MITQVEPAREAAALPEASQNLRVHFESLDVQGNPIVETGLVHVPHGRPPVTGWPVASFGHMTTGGSDYAAPSLASFGHPELRRMTQGDAFIARLLERGIAVVRPDYEGIGSSGTHPYLIGPSLARSVIDLVVAASAEFGFSRQWLSTGHSEGAVAALWAASLAGQDEAIADAEVDLAGVCAFTPVTRMDVSIGFSLRVPFVVPGWEVVSPLIVLMLSGAATVDPHMRALLEGSGLSEAARAIWGHLGERSLVELSRSDSFGAIAPSRLLTDAKTERAEIKKRLFDSFRRNEVANLSFPAGTRMRVEAARFDEVAPLWLTARALGQWESGGVDLSRRWWNASHSPVLREDRAPVGAADWCVSLLR